MAEKEAVPNSEGNGASATPATIDPLKIQWLESLPDGVKLAKDVLDPENKTKGIYGEADPESYEVRGDNYLVDKKKFPSQQAMFTLVAATIFEHDKPMPHMAKRSPTLKKAVNTPGAPFAFIVTWLIPGPPYYTVTIVFARKIPVGKDPKFDKLFKKFCTGKDDISNRKARFKFIPNIVKSPWFVKAPLAALGGMRPVIIGNKIENLYFNGPNYTEVVINIGSSSVAAGITKICKGALKTMIVDLGFLLEAGHEPEFEAELPERMIACCRFKNCDLGGAPLKVDFDISDLE